MLKRIKQTASSKKGESYIYVCVLVLFISMLVSVVIMYMGLMAQVQIQKLNGNEIEGFDVMKTKSSYRSLPLMPFIKKALEEEKARQEEMQRVLRKSYNRKYLDYVCVDAMGDILKPQYVTEHFKVILERNGLKKIRFHDLRHSCASLMLANDISMKEIQEWLGHSNISTTANIYAHVDSESKRESAKIIGKVLSSEEAV